MRQIRSSAFVGTVAGKKLSRRGRLALAGALAVPVIASSSHAANLYWDLNGATANAIDTGNQASGNWDNVSTNWNTVANGTGAVGTWVSTETAVFSAGTSASGTFGINVSGAQTAAGITVEEGVITFSGDQITLTGPTISAATATTIVNVIAGSAGLTKAGGSTLTLQGNNTYSGNTTVSAGTLVLQSDANLGAVPGSPTDSLFVATTLRGNGTFTLDANRTVVIGPVAGTGSGTATFDVTTGNTMTVAGNVKANGTSTASLTKTGTGTLILAGNVSHTGALNANVGVLEVTGNASYGGLTSVNGGTLTLSGSNSLTGATTVANGTLNLLYTANNNDKINAAGLLTANHLGVVTMTGSDTGATSQTVNGLTLGTNGTSTINLNRGSNQDITLNVGAITRGAGAVTNFAAGGSGSGTTNITTTNTGTNGILGGYATYNGDTWAAVSGGGSVTPLTAYDVNDFGDATKNTDVTSDQSPAADTSVNSLRFNTGATLNLAGANTVTTGGILVTPGGSGAINGGSLTSGAADLVVHQNNQSSEFTIGSDLTGSVGFTKAGLGTVVLAGNNTNTGPYTVVAGTLKLGGGNRINDTSSVIVSTGATLDTNFTDEAIGNLSGFGSVNISGIYLTTGNNPAAATFSGPFVGGGGLVKVGTGTQTLSGASPSFTGETNIQAGVLSVTNATALGQSVVTISSGAALQLSGTINVANNIIVSGTGINNAGAIRKTANNTTTWSGGMELAADARINSDAGTLSLAGGIETLGFTLTLGGAGNFTIPAGGRILGPGAVIKEGTGTLTIANGTTSGWTGGFIIKQGLVTFATISGSGAPALGGATNPIILDGGTLQNTNTGVGGGYIGSAHPFHITANGGTVDVLGLPTIQTTPLTLAPGTDPGLPTTVLTKTGAGDFGTPAASMAMTKLVVNAGYYRLRTGATEAAFGLVPEAPLADAITLNGGGIGTAVTVSLNANRGITIGPNGGLFSITAGSVLTIPGAITGSSKITFSNSGTTIFSNPGNVTSYTGALEMNSSVLTLNESLIVTNLFGNGGTINAAAGKSLTAGSDGTSTSFAGIIGGSGAFNKVGTGTLTLTPATNEWTNTGGVNVNQGTLKFGTAAAGFGNSTVTVAAGATLDMNNINDTNGGLAGAGSVINMGNLTTGGNNASTTFSGTLAGTGSLTKAGTGTLTITQPLDRPTVTVNAGTLKLDTGASLASRIGSLTSTAGQTDLTAGRLVLTGTTVDSLRGMLATGRAPDGGGIGQWTGNGVMASAAAADANKVTGIGYLTAAEAGLTGSSWGGVTNLAASDLLVRVGPIGDLDLSGTLTRDDLALFDLGLALFESGAIAAGSGTHLRGDVTYDGIVDASDAFQVLRSASSNGLASPSMLAGYDAMFGAGFSAQALASVPEPTSLLAACGLAIPMVMRRRSRR